MDSPLLQGSAWLDTIVMGPQCSLVGICVPYRTPVQSGLPTRQHVIMDTTALIMGSPLQQGSACPDTTVMDLQCSLVGIKYSRALARCAEKY